MIGTEALGLLLGVVLLCYFLLTRHHGFWKRLHIPSEEPLLLFGNLKEVALARRDIGHHLKHLYDKHRDKRYVGMFAFHLPVLLVRDLELVKNVLVKDFNCFVDRNLAVDDSLDPLNGKAIFALTGDKWRQMRNNLTPVFTSGKMKNMFYLVDQRGRDLVRYLDTITSKERRVEVFETMSRFTVDVMSSCAFGVDSNSLGGESAQFSRLLRGLFSFSFMQAVVNLATFFAPVLHTVSRVKLTSKEVEGLLRSAVWGVIDYREKNGVNRRDFLDTMMEVRKKGEDFDGDNLVAQAFGFLTAGFETSATTMSFVLFELAQHPEVQSRLRTEIQQVMERHNQEVTYDSLQEMTYLDVVVNETLRKYSIIPFLNRKSLQDYELPAPSGQGTRTLPAGTGVFIATLAMHHDPEFFPEPHKFDPERFSEENKRSIPPYAYLPFGVGPRNCIGLRFAYMQVKTGLIHILTRYEVAPCSDTPKSLKMNPKNFVVKAEGEIPLSFNKLLV